MHIPFYLYLYFTIAYKDLQSIEGTVFRTYKGMSLEVSLWADNGVTRLEEGVELRDEITRLEKLEVEL